jgi:hypothetical protein
MAFAGTEINRNIKPSGSTVVINWLYGETVA